MEKIPVQSSEKLNKLIHERNRMVIQSPYTENGMDVIRVQDWKKQRAHFVGTLFDTFLFKSSNSEIEKVLIEKISEWRMQQHLPSFADRAETMKKEIELALEKIKKERGGNYFDASTQQRYERELKEDVRKNMNGSLTV